MSTITATRRVVNPTRRTTVLFDATQRHPARRDFGRGVLRSLPTFKAPASAEDMAWAAREFNADLTAYDRELERRAAEAEALDRLTAGTLL